MRLEDIYNIEIKQQDYDGAIRQNCEKCLVARAIRRSIPGTKVSVTSGSGIHINDQRYRAIRGYDVISDFDCGACSEALVGRVVVVERA